jgi:hypothetical protein
MLLALTLSAAADGPAGTLSSSCNLPVCVFTAAETLWCTRVGYMWAQKGFVPPAIFLYQYRMFRRDGIHCGQTNLLTHTTAA